MRCLISKLWSQRFRNHSARSKLGIRKKNIAIHLLQKAWRCCAREIATAYSTVYLFVGPHVFDICGFLQQQFVDYKFIRRCGYPGNGRPKRIWADLCGTTHLNEHFDASNLHGFNENARLYYRYPFGISKKSLLSVGSTFTWPHLLGVFSFLIDVIGVFF